MTDIASLRLELARSLWKAERLEESLIEVRAGLREQPDPATRASLHHVAGGLLACQSRLTDALADWITAIITDPTVAAPSAYAVAATLDGPRSETLARQIPEDLVRQLEVVGTRSDTLLAIQVLWLRVRRLRQPAGVVTDLRVPDLIDTDDDLRALVADELAAASRLEEALALLDAPPVATSPRSVATRARLLIRLGRPGEVLMLAVPEGLSTDDLVLQSLAVSRALAQLAANDSTMAAAELEPYSATMAVEPQLAAVVVALSRGDYPAADSLLVGVEGLSGRSDDVRLLRAQICLEAGTAEDVERGENLLSKLVRTSRTSTSEAAQTRAASIPIWLSRQLQVRLSDDRFGFVWAEWSARTAEPTRAIDVLAAATRTRTTVVQDAAMDVLWGDLLLAAGKTQDGADRLVEASRSWVMGGVFQRALDSARRAQEIDPVHSDAVADVLMRQGYDLLDEAESRPESAAEALQLARQAWELARSEDIAMLWADAAVQCSYPEPGPDAERLLIEATEKLRQAPSSAKVFRERGWVFLRLGDVAAERKLDHNIQAATWLLGAALLEPENTAVWNWLSWALSALGANWLSWRAAVTSSAQNPNEAWAMSTLVAARANHLGTLDEVDPELLESVAADPEQTEWANAIRLRLAAAVGDVEAIRRLLIDPDPGHPAWIASTLADCLALVGDPRAGDAADQSLELDLAAFSYGSAVRNRLLRGYTDQAVELLDRARAARNDTEGTLRRLDLLRRLVTADPGAEADLQADVDRTTSPALLLNDIHVDLMLLASTLEPGSDRWEAVRRIQEASRRRLGQLKAGYPATAAQDLDEDATPDLLTLCGLWDLVDDGCPRTDLAAGLKEVRRTPGAPDLEELLGTVERAVGERLADGLLDRATIAGSDDEPIDAALDDLDGWLPLVAPHRRQEAAALQTLRHLLRGDRLDELLPLAPGDQLSTQCESLGRYWSTHLTDVASWWRLHEALVGAVPAAAFDEIRKSLLPRLAELSAFVSPASTDGSPQGLLMGADLVPDDTSTTGWVMFTDYIPAIRSAVAEMTGCRLFGFNLRYDRYLDRGLTFVANGQVTEFTQFPGTGGHFVASDTDELAELSDPRTGEPLILVSDPGVTSPDHPQSPDAEGYSVTRLVARHLLAWSLSHIAELFNIYHVATWAWDLDPLSKAALDNPACIVRWLDASRAALTAGRRLDSGVVVEELLRSEDTSDQLTDDATQIARVVAALGPWTALPKETP